MRDHEIELIAGLAEGTLDDETAARALIESSAEALAEFQAQKSALTALSAALPAEMSEHERAALRRDVWTALGKESQPVVGTPWYYRLSYAAAGLLVVVGLVSVLNRPGDDERAGLSRTETAELSADAADTTIAQAGEDETMRDADGDALGGGAAPDTTSTMSLPPEEFFADEAQRVRLGQPQDPSSSGDGQLEEDTVCVDTAGLSGYRVVGEVISDTEPDGTAVTFIVAVPPGGIDDSTPVAFVLADRCEVATIER